MDSSSHSLQIIILVTLVLFSAFFSASETALTSLSHVKRRKIFAEKGEKRDGNTKYLEKLYNNPGRMLTTILVGNTMVNIISSIIATFLFVDLLSLENIQNEIVVAMITTLIMTSIILIFGEISPKMIALKNNEKLAIFFSRPIYYVSLILFPLIEIFHHTSQIITKLTRGKSLEKHSLVSEEEIKIFINLGLQEGVLEEGEEKMLTSIIEFGDIVVREIMTPRPAIIAVDVKSTIRRVVNIIRQHWHSRIPVYSEKMDNIVGFVYAKDLLSVTPENLDNTSYLKTIIREAYFVPESKRIDELLKEMQKEKRHSAMVVDEYGGISGLITIEDILEEIVGEINDEYDNKEEVMIEKIRDNVYSINGLINVADLNDELNINIPEADNYDSIAGFVVDKLGKMPSKGDIHEDEKFKFEIVNVFKRRITKIKLEIKEGEQNSDS